MSRNRGQVSTEFFTYSGVFLAFVAMIAGVVFFVQGAEMAEKESLLARETGEQFADAVSLAVRAGDGFTYNMDYPKTLLGGEYQVYFVPKTDKGVIIINWKGKYGEYTFSYVVPPVIMEKDTEDDGGADNCIKQSGTSTSLMFNSTRGNDNTLAIRNKKDRERSILYLYQKGCGSE
ncbi:MAG: hypothetical protein ACP5NX_03040 [Candidatus Bilamarchaeaceae archaeon]